ncbi:MAG: transposase, partial [Candidatus Micrarchaeia archaeon]
LYNWLLQNLFKGRQLRLMAQDSTDIPAYSKKDKDAHYGHKTPSKKEQIARKEAKKEYVFGYKLHASADAESEVSLVSVVAPANKHDKTFFHQIYGGIKNMFVITYDTKYLLDAAYDSTDIYQELHYDNVKPVIAINGRGFYKSKLPKDSSYGKRWAIERIFSRLKEVFGLARNRFVGIAKVTIFVFSFLIAYLIKYAM